VPADRPERASGAIEQTVQASSLSELTLSCCGKAGLGHFLRYFSLNRMTIRLKRAQKLPQTGLPLATNDQVRQAARAEKPRADITPTRDLYAGAGNHLHS
jgi:hypothetical protein